MAASLKPEELGKKLDLLERRLTFQENDSRSGWCLLDVFVLSVVVCGVLVWSCGGCDATIIFATRTIRLENI